MKALNPPQPVVDIARALEERGFETWCVGGAVRDALLGHPHLDWDLATAATPDDVRDLFGRRRTIPVGVEHGTVGVLDANGAMHEVTTFRRDVKTDGRHAVVEFGASLDEDLARRDFTINAIAYHPTRAELRDPFKGREDLDRRVIKAVGVASERMREDRLRALRAIRFAARFDFTIEPETLDAIRDSASALTRLSAERVQQEIVKTMEQVAAPSRAFRVWRDVGAFGTLVPELATVRTADLEVLDCVRYVDGSPMRRRDAARLLRISALFASTTPDAARDALRRLKFSNDLVNRAAQMIARTGEIDAEIRQAATPALTDAFIRQSILARTGRTGARLVLRLLLAKWAVERATDPRTPSADAARRMYGRAIRIAFRDPIELSDLALDGDDLRSLGLPPGPRVGEILRDLLRDVLVDPSVNTREMLLPRAERLVRGAGDSANTPDVTNRNSSD